MAYFFGSSLHDDECGEVEVVVYILVLDCGAGVVDVVYCVDS